MFADPVRLQRACVAALVLPFLCHGAWLTGWPSGLAALSAAAFLTAIVLVLLFARPADRYVAGVLVTGLLVVSLGSPSGGWDARSIWLFHGKRIFLDANAAPTLDGYAFQPDYPLLVPAFMASLASLQGTWNELFPKSASVLLLTPVMPLVLGHLGNVPSKIALCCFLLWSGDTLLVNGYMDALLAMYFVAAFVSAAALSLAPTDSATPARPTGARHVLPAALVFATLPLIKNEGVVALLILLFVTIAIGMRVNRRLPPKRLVTAAATALVPVGLWRLDVASHGIVNDLDLWGAGARFVARFADVSAQSRILEAMLSRPELLLPLWVITLRARVVMDQPFLLAGLITALGYGFAIYIVYLSTVHDVTWHLATSVDRTMLPIVLLLGFVALCALQRDGQSAGRPEAGGCG